MSLTLQFHRTVIFVHRRIQTILYKLERSIGSAVYNFRHSFHLLAREILKHIRRGIHFSGRTPNAKSQTREVLCAKLSDRRSHASLPARTSLGTDANGAKGNI